MSVKNIKRQQRRQQAINIPLARFEELFPGYHERYVPLDGRCIHCVNLILRDYDDCLEKGIAFRFSKHVDLGYNEIANCLTLTSSGKLRYVLV